MFIQSMEIVTRHLPEAEALAKEWSAQTEGRRTAIRSTTARDLSGTDSYLLLVEFPDAEAARRNSDLPETGEFAAKLAALCEGTIGYRDLDVVSVLDHDAGGRKVIDCRDMPSESGCTLTIAGTPDEVVIAAAEHAVSVHGHTDGEELRNALRGALKDEVAAHADVSG